MRLAWRSNGNGGRWLAPALVLALLAVVGFIVFGRTGGFSFLHFDDDLYVFENRVINAGLTWEGARWALSSVHASNWHPVTWWSHMMDVAWFGLDPGRHHRTNVILHVANAQLMFLLWWRMTGALRRSALVAFLFAVHPLHVESVAWIAERKDVLSTFFGLVAALAYVHYARGPNWVRYAGTVVPFALALMAKSMLVTLPFVFLLLDFWPLGRFDGSAGRVRRLVFEKVPLLLLSLAVGAITYLAQTAGPWREPLGTFPPGLRVANGVVAYATYLAKAAWPTSLSPFYPHPGTVGATIPAGTLITASAFLALVSICIALLGRSRPYLPVGWLWFVGLLLPTIGIVQVGAQSLADRYTYLPLTGIFVIVAWGGADLAERWRVPRSVTGFIVALWLAALAWLAVHQVGHWRNDASLFSHALNLNRENWLAWNNLGLDHQNSGRVLEAVRCYEEAIRIKPDYAAAWYNLGSARDELDARDEAETAYRRAIEIWPRYAKAWLNLGVLQADRGRPDLAIEFYDEALRIDPGLAEGWYDLGLALVRTAQSERAVLAFRNAVRQRPSFPEAWRELAELSRALGRHDEAAEAERMGRRAPRP